MPLHLPRALQAPFAALTCTAGVLVTGCGSDVAAFDFNAPTGQFGTPAAPDSGSIDGGTASDSDGNVSDGGGPTVMVRVVHGMPNVGALVLCRFPALRLDDPSTPADELERDNTTGELVTDVGPLAVGLSFGEVSQWVRLRIADTGVLSLHRAPTPEPADAGIPSDAGGRDAGLADASTAHDASADASAPAAMPCESGEPRSGAATAAARRLAATARGSAADDPRGRCGSRRCRRHAR